MSEIFVCINWKLVIIQCVTLLKIRIFLNNKIAEYNIIKKGIGYIKIIANWQDWHVDKTCER